MSIETQIRRSLGEPSARMADALRARGYSVEVQSAGFLRVSGNGLERPATLAPSWSLVWSFIGQ